MRIWVVYQWDIFDNMEFGHRYFLDKDTAMKYYYNNANNNSDGYWDWDEIIVEG